jgi:phosphatidylethanolamine-binding protein (PEBP) family uncharacterized protein
MHMSSNAVSTRSLASPVRWSACVMAMVVPWLAACATNSEVMPIDASTANLHVTSSALVEGATLPTSLKCTRDGGTGASPPMTWTGAPSATQSYAVLIYHYPNGTVPGVDTPNHYWLLWNIGGNVIELTQGNSAHIGTQGSDKDGRATGYTPPCSPIGSGTHTYHIRVYALSAAPTTLGATDSLAVDYATFIAAINPLTLASGELSFSESN